MVTDPPPGNHTLRVEFLKSDRIDSLDLPQDDGLCRLAKSIAKALNSEIRRGVCRFPVQYGWVLRSTEASDSRSSIFQFKNDPEAGLGG